jgi:hypothetical protein
VSVIDRRLRAVFRKYKFSGLAFISVLGLASVFAVNIAGFLVLLPRPLWGLLDVSFVSSYFIRFSILLSLAFLASRYSGYFVASFFGPIYGTFVVISLLMKKSGRRFIRITGYERAFFTAKRFLRRNEHEDKGGDHMIDYESLAGKLYNSKFVRYPLGLAYIMGYTRGRIYYLLEHYAIPFQLLAVIFVLSALYTTLTGGIILVALAIIIVIILPPTLFGIYHEKPYFEAGISYFTAMKFELWKLIPLQKITLLALTLSFVSGILHHRSLVSENMLLSFVGEVNVTGSLILTASSGFIIHSTAGGYQFIPIHGTRINVLALDLETTH